MNVTHPTSQDAAFESLLRAVRTDEDWGYPTNVAFIGRGVDRAPELAWRALSEGRDVIFVDQDGAEMWIEVIRDRSITSLISRFTRRVPIRLRFRAEPVESKGNIATPGSAETPLIEVKVSRKSFPKVIGPLGAAH